jgi:phosphatidylglycerophosphate synthase
MTVSRPSTDASLADQKVASTGVAGKNASDGAYCQVVQRRISGFVSPWFARRMGPNAVTGLGLAVGLAASAAAVTGLFVVAAALIQLFGVLSCVDGEVARARGQTSPAGDFFDTMVDRIVEVLAIATIAAAAGLDGRPKALGAGMALTAAVLLLVVSTEKYRSAFGEGYPKRIWEPAFSWASAGSDGRLLILSCGLVAAAVTGSATALEVTLWSLAGFCGANLLWRAGILWRRLKRDHLPAEEEIEP